MEILYTGTDEPLFVDKGEFVVNSGIPNYKGTLILMQKLERRMFPPTDFDVFYVHAVGLDETNALTFKGVYDHPNALRYDDRASYTMIIEPPTCSEVDTWRYCNFDDTQHVVKDHKEVLSDHEFFEELYKRSNGVYCRNSLITVNETLLLNDLITVNYENISILMLCVDRTKSSILGILLDPVNNNNRRICIYLPNNQSNTCSVTGYCDDIVYWTREHITFRKATIKEMI
jgi:hypothetical protein